MSKDGDSGIRIIGFLCNWCCYGGADLCGVSRFQYPPFLRVIRVMCSGRVDLSFILRAFSNGVDGVFIGGCHINDCHYNTEGNYDALAITLLCKKLLEYIGINPDRLRLEWVSAGEGIRFAEVITDFSNKIKALGPLGQWEGLDQEQLKVKLDAATQLIPYLRLLEHQRLRLPHMPEQEYRTFFDSEEFKRLFNETVSEKMVVAQIVSLVQGGPRSTSEIAQRLALSPSEVSRHLNVSSRHGLVRYDPELKGYVAA